jgi:hypothetical protein
VRPAEVGLSVRARPKRDLADIARAVQEPDDAGFGLGDTKINAVTAEYRHAQAGAYPFSGNTRVPNVRQSGHVGVDLVGEREGHLQASRVDKVNQRFVDVGSCQCSDMKLFGAEG